MLQKIIHFELSINLKIPGKKTQHSLYKKIVFNIDNNKKYFLRTKSAYLSLKDHMTLKDWSNGYWKFSNKLHFKIY